MKLKLNLAFLFDLWVVIMSENICPTNFKKFMAFNGILHQTCAHTPQQNRVVKHKKSESR